MNTSDLGRRRVAIGVVLATAIALAVRLVELGYRVFHWDEGRVGYLVLRYMETGVWEYRSIVHGPFLFHINEELLAVLGPTDFAARLPVALIGGLLPLMAWLFRDRLKETEVVALAGFLALNPVLVYYSRFMRNDVLVGAFALAAVGFAVRAVDTRRHRYVYAGAAALALAFTAKENAILYVLCFGGALFLLFDQELFSSRARGGDWRTTAVDTIRGRARGLWAWRVPILLATVEFFVIVVFFYAPRPDLYQAFAAPAKLPSVVYAATVGSVNEFLSWSGGGHLKHSYADFLKEAAIVHVAAALPLSVFAVGGFLADRYSGERPRTVVAFASYWGFASVLGYPAVTDIAGHWSVVHAVIPLAIPAAVGVRLVVDRGRRALARDDQVSLALVALILLAVIGQVAVTTYDTSFARPQDDDNVLVQYGQPSGHIQDKLAQVERIARENEEGTDVLFFGSHFYVAGESADQRPRIPQGDWFNRLPLPWYLERADATVDSTTSATAVEENPPPVVIARVTHYGTLAPKLEGYEAYTFELTSSGTETVIFVENSTRS